MKHLNNVLIAIFLFSLTLSSCTEDDDLTRIQDYNVSIVFLGGYSKFISIYTNAPSANESAVAFTPVENSTVKELMVKVTRNALTSSARIVLRKNGGDTPLVVEIPKGETGYFSSTNAEDVITSDEINLFIDATDSQERVIDCTVRVVLESK